MLLVKQARSDEMKQEGCSIQPFRTIHILSDLFLSEILVSACQRYPGRIKQMEMLQRAGKDELWITTK